MLLILLFQNICCSNFDHRIINYTYISETVENLSTVQGTTKTYSYSNVKNSKRNSYFIASTIELSYCNYVGCFSLSQQREHRYGGGIFLQGCLLDVIGCTFSKCIAHYGGSIGLLDTYCFIYNSHFNDSTAFYDGGGFYSMVTPNTQAVNNWINITQITMKNCSAFVHGGGVSITGCNFSGIRTSDFVDCKAGVAGGGIHICNSYCIIDFCGFYGNYVHYMMRTNRHFQYTYDNSIRRNQRGGGGLAIMFPEDTIQYYKWTYNIDCSVFIFAPCFSRNGVESNDGSENVLGYGAFDLYVPSNADGYKTDSQTVVNRVLPEYNYCNDNKYTVTNPAMTKVPSGYQNGKVENTNLPPLKKVLTSFSAQRSYKTTAYPTVKYTGRTTMHRAIKPHNDPTPSRSRSATPSRSRSLSPTPSFMPTKSLGGNDPTPTPSPSPSASPSQSLMMSIPTPSYIYHGTTATFSLPPGYYVSWTQSLVSTSVTTVVQSMTSTRTWVETGTLINTATETITYTVSGTNIVPTHTSTLTRTFTSAESTYVDVPTMSDTFTKTLTVTSTNTSLVDLKNYSSTILPTRSYAQDIIGNYDPTINYLPEMVLTHTSTLTYLPAICEYDTVTFMFTGPILMNHTATTIYTTKVEEAKWIVQNGTATIGITIAYIQTYAVGYGTVENYVISSPHQSHIVEVCQPLNMTETITVTETFTRPDVPPSFTLTDTVTYTMVPTYTWVPTTSCTYSGGRTVCHSVEIWTSTSVLSETTTHEYAALGPSWATGGNGGIGDGDVVPKTSFIGYILAALVMIIGISGLVYSELRDRHHRIGNDEEGTIANDNDEGVIISDSNEGYEAPLLGESPI